MNREAAEAEARKLAKQGQGRNRIMAATGLGEKAVRRIIHQEKARGELLVELAGQIPEPAPYQVVPAAPAAMSNRYMSAVDSFNALIGKRSEAFTPCTRPANERWAVFSDIHMPFHDMEKLIAACDKAEAEGCGGLILAGDTFDLYTVSRYAKEKKITLEEELAKARVGFEYLASRFPAVRIFWGNHEKGRWERFLTEFVHEQFHFLIPDFRQVLVGGIPNVEQVGHTTSWGKELVWFYQLGKDAILTHCEKSSANQGVNLERLKPYFREWAGVLGVNKDFRFLSTGHTHRLTVHHDFDCLLMESGMLASWEAQEYQMGPHAANKKPGVHGFLIIQQHNGVTDLAECKAVRLAS